MRLKHFLLLVIAVLVAVPAAAQTSLTSTTVSTAVTNTTTNVIQVASATGITANTTGLFVPTTGEYMPVTAVNGTNITVVRGGGGAFPARPIAGSATVIIAPRAATFVGANPFGACTGANTPQYFQLINLQTADVNVCLLTSGLWEARNGLPLNYDTTVVLTR
jgi:hypothetical protein